MSEREILIRMATVGSVLAAICTVYAAGGLATVLVGAAVADIVLRNIEAARVRNRIALGGQGDS